LAEIAQSGDQAAVAAQVKKLGAACGSCHEVFR
ncbi:MAG: cytochrome c, partial [Deltaproteobacteria bacterium]|nr:cytochrome c [Deltaproteobacteria bacterium]